MKDSSRKGCWRDKAQKLGKTTSSLEHSEKEEKWKALCYGSIDKTTTNTNIRGDLTKTESSRAGGYSEMIRAFTVENFTKAKSMVAESSHTLTRPSTKGNTGMDSNQEEGSSYPPMAALPSRATSKKASPMAWALDTFKKSAKMVEKSIKNSKANG